ncbi:MAG: hypothetical protein QGH07_07465 [Alphaproteobacteria bacterium]|nr:hypothetical protein [Alphaproteobacteria bacterium]
MKFAGSLIFKFTKAGLFFAADSVAMVGLSIEIAIAASTPIACQPYVNGKLRETLSTFFCLKREDANALIELMEAPRLEKISQKEARIRMAEFQSTKECFFVATQHTSIRTVHQGQEAGKIYDSFGMDSTKWPSLIEAELAGDQSTIWVLTNAIVPPVEQ